MFTVGSGIAVGCDCQDVASCYLARMMRDIKYLKIVESGQDLGPRPIVSMAGETPFKPPFIDGDGW